MCYTRHSENINHRKPITQPRCLNTNTPLQPIPTVLHSALLPLDNKFHSPTSSSGHSAQAFPFPFTPRLPLVSIPNGLYRPFRRLNERSCGSEQLWFQSQTGSTGHSDIL